MAKEIKQKSDKMITEQIKIGTKVLTPTNGIGIFKGWAEPLGKQRIAKVAFEDRSNEPNVLYRDIDLIEMQ